MNDQISRDRIVPVNRFILALHSHRPCFVFVHPKLIKPFFEASDGQLVACHVFAGWKEGVREERELLLRSEKVIAVISWSNLGQAKDLALLHFYIETAFLSDSWVVGKSCDD